LYGTVVESHANITVASGGVVSFYGPLPNSGAYALLVYDRFESSNGYASYNYSINNYVWDTNNPVIGDTDPWVIAVAAATVPEPSCLTLAALGALFGVVYGVARKGMAQRESLPIGE
jgi:hypothetical protein